MQGASPPLPKSAMLSACQLLMRTGCSPGANGGKATLDGYRPLRPGWDCRSDPMNLFLGGFSRFGIAARIALERPPGAGVGELALLTLKGLGGGLSGSNFDFQAAFVFCSGHPPRCRPGRARL